MAAALGNQEAGLEPGPGHAVWDDQQYVLTSREALLREVVRKYGPQLRIYFARNLRCYDDVDDLLQDLYVRIVTYADPGGIRSLKSFIFTIAANLLRDRSRRSCTHLTEQCTSIDSVGEIPVTCVDPAKILGDRDAVKEMSVAIDRLAPSDCKTAFLQHRFEEKSYKEIAFGLGVSVSMVEKHIIGALKQLREFVELD